MISAYVFGLLTFATATFAHGDHLLSREQFHTRSILAEERHLKARNCLSEIADFTHRRKVKRTTLRRRQLDLNESCTPTFTTASHTISVPPPRTSAIPNLDNYTCVAAPDVVEGPYYINNEMVRYNLTEGQAGVELILDIGVINIATCQPFPDLFVELWSANATGVYAGFSRTSTPGSTTTISAPATTTTSRPPMLRNETFLRGGLPTDENGVVELVTLYPGFYAGRASHIHAMFHHNWAMSPNGTLISQVGTNVHTGQVFFEEVWNDEIYATELYKNNDNVRVCNHEDRILNRLSNADRDNVFVDLEKLGNSLDDGLYGYITIAIDPKNTVRINGTHYLNSTGYEPTPAPSLHRL
ncbi:Intradiol ring-cleavage dioxygenase [Pterulicium gracile]|uniref:Intradiol ring-cleavage dioxygenase n=1 Tax=Pterulicium gracile TaxID=1884261 RepID=A0A5C3QSB7_9AGAR|nr:Intradiol ring-cleavage dioxygenase [Pterula gracilis]